MQASRRYKIVHTLRWTRNSIIAFAQRADRRLDELAPNRSDRTLSPLGNARHDHRVLYPARQSGTDQELPFFSAICFRELLFHRTLPFGMIDIRQMLDETDRPQPLGPISDMGLTV